MFEKFISSLELENWIILYIFFEINLIKELGYDVNLKKFNKANMLHNQSSKVIIDGFRYEVPNYLITQKLPNQINNFLIKKSLIFTRSVMVNKFFLPNNLIFPKSRIILENYFN